MLGYVVVEWNQASLQPSLPTGQLHAVRLWAEDEAEWLRSVLPAARRETYTIATVEEDLA